MAQHLIPSDRTIKAIKQGDPRQRVSDGAGLHLKLFVRGGSHGWRYDYAFDGLQSFLSAEPEPRSRGFRLRLLGKSRF
jgi:hypothetical protein